jgi:hypothetical protein
VVLVLLQNRPHGDDLVLAVKVYFSSSQSFAPLVRDANEMVSIRMAAIDAGLERISRTRRQAAGYFD